MEQLYVRDIFEYPVKEFRSHLESETNERIIFSGKYATEKTKFLNDFFNPDID
jgi:hypothetical protein